jgi:exonuclease VII small subunit
MDKEIRIEKLEEEGKLIIKIVDRLEQRIAKLEKVLASHAKCIGQLRGANEFKILSRSRL